MRPIVAARVLAPILALSAVGARAAPESTAAPTTIPSIATWTDSDGTPTADAWQHAAHFAVDNEIQPGHNVPAPVTTDVAVGYTSTALWLHFVARDPHPADVRLKYRQHDGFNDNDEYVGIIFSPFNDTQWGYEFFCTASGTESDSFRQQNNEYSSFDAIWYCNAHLTPTGYTVTMQIPFRSLKFPHSDAPQTWRLLLFRNWARSVRHQITQARLDYDSNCTLCQAELVRTQTPIHAKGGNFLIIPAATVSQTDARATPNSGLAHGSPTVAAGLDARWAIRPDLEWSATLNPNFSQVAPDVLQSTVNQRFALYYPENRPFFEEGTWVFNTPGFNYGKYNGNKNATNQFVDTRQVADPDWATKVVGQIGSNALGALVADDSITNILMPGPVQSRLQSFDFPTRDGLLRYRRDFAGNSAVGVLATNRTGNGYDNGLFAVDGSWQIDPSDTLTTQLAHSSTTYPQQVATAFGIAPGRVSGDGWLVAFQRTRSNYTANLLVASVAPGFRADMGYLPQVGYREVQPQFEYDWYSNDSWWNNGGFGASYDWVQASGNGPMLDLQAQIYAFVHAVGQSHVVLTARHDEQYFGGRTFTLGQYEIDASAQPLRWLQFEVDATGGDGVDYVGVRKGRLLSIAPSFTLSPGPHLEIDFVGNFEQLDVAGERLYTARLYDLRAAWYFNSRMFVRAIAQEQDVRNNVALYPPGTPNRTRTLASQFLFGYMLNPWTSLFAGYTDNYLGTGDTGLVQQGRTYFLKVSYAFQL